MNDFRSVQTESAMVSAHSHPLKASLSRSVPLSARHFDLPDHLRSVHRQVVIGSRRRVRIVRRTAVSHQAKLSDPAENLLLSLW